MRPLQILTTAALLSGGVVTVTPAPAEAAACWYHVSAGRPVNLWVRNGPGPRFRRVDWIPWDTTVRGACWARNAWVQVRGVNGRVGWAFRPGLARGRPIGQGCRRFCDGGLEGGPGWGPNGGTPCCGPSGGWGRWRQQGQWEWGGWGS